MNPAGYLLILIAWLSAIDLLWAQPTPSAALIELAKKEGKVVWYTSMAIDTSKPLLDAFLKDTRSSERILCGQEKSRLMTRIMNETRAGKWSFDVVSGSAISTLVDRKIISPYLSPERDAYMSEFKDPQGYWAGIFEKHRH